MTVTQWLTDTRGRHTHSHTSQCEVGVRQHNQWYWQSARSPGGANPVECLNINVKWSQLEFRARQVKQSEAWSEWQVTEGCAILLLVRTTLIGLSIAANIWGVLDLDRQEGIIVQNNPALDLTVSWVGRWWQHVLKLVLLKCLLLFFIHLQPNCQLQMKKNISTDEK